MSIVCARALSSQASCSDLTVPVVLFASISLPPYIPLCFFLCHPTSHCVSLCVPVCLSACKRLSDVTAWVTTSHGCTVPIIHIKHKNPRFTLLFSHGNAEDIGVNKLFNEWLSQQLQVDIVTYDYTGYGLSAGGDPSEHFLYSDR